jgi:hypothetical protein
MCMQPVSLGGEPPVGFEPPDFPRAVGVTLLGSIESVDFDNTNLF